MLITAIDWKENMQIIVIGNGYDLASGLPTRYTDYFEYYFKENNDIFSAIGEFKNNLRIMSSEYPDINSRPMIPQVPLEYNHFQNQRILDQIEKIIDRDVSLWHLHFWLERNNSKKGPNWSDIESELLKILQNEIDSILSFGKSPHADYKMSDAYLHAVEFENLTGKIRAIQNTRSATIKDNFPIFMKFVVLKIIEKKYGFISFSEAARVLKNELKLLENSFKEYVANTYNSYVLGPTQKPSAFYRDNLGKIIDLKDTDCYILNFNYTDLSYTTRKTKFSFERNKIQYQGIQNNVHGVYYDEIIFGIDQTNITAEDSHHIFSKTFRKLESTESLVNLKLPDKKDVNTISFYGHSLG